MPSLNFPTNPTIGDQYNDWVWNGGQWDFRQTLPGGLPAGAIIQWGGSTAPVNWLLCDGSAVSRTTYASLFAAVGTSYGAGDGSTTFNLPDLRGRVPVGKNGGSFGTLGATGGAETVSLDGNNLPAHTHTFSATTSTDGYHSHGLSNNASNMVSDANQGINWATAGGASYGFRNSTILGNGSHSHTLSGTTSSSGSGSAHNNLQPYQVVNYIIKATAAVTPGESELAGRVGTLESTRALKAGDTFTGILIGKTNTGGTVGGTMDVGSFSARGDATNAAVVTFHRPSYSWTNIGLDTDNNFKVGGGSLPSSSMVVDTSGRVTKPSQTAFMMYTASGTAYHSGGWMNIALLPTSGGVSTITTKYNVGGNFNTSNGRFTAPVAGQYLFYVGGWAAYNGAGNRYAACFVVNGGATNFITGANYSAGDSPVAMSPIVISLAAGDYVMLNMFSAVATTLGTGSHHFYYGGYLLG